MTLPFSLSSTLSSTASAPDAQRPDPSATPLLEIPKVTRDDGTKGRRPASDRSPARSTAPGSAASDNRAAESATSDGASVVPSPTAGSLNLLQRLTAIAREVEVKATGNTGRAAGNQRAISIGDVDEALGPLFVKHGVVSDYQFEDAPTSFKLPTRDGEMTMWQVMIQARIYNIDNPGDCYYRTLSDIGSNPSAAVSFALKRWLRALFKLVEDDEQPEDRSGIARPNTAKADAAAVAHLTADELMELDRLNKLCPAPVPDGLAWNSMLKGRDFPTLKGMLEKRYATQTKDEA